MFLHRFYGKPLAQGIKSQPCRRLYCRGRRGLAECFSKPFRSIFLCSRLLLKAPILCRALRVQSSHYAQARRVVSLYRKAFGIFRRQQERQLLRQLNLRNALRFYSRTKPQGHNRLCSLHTTHRSCCLMCLFSRLSNAMCPVTGCSLIFLLA